MGKIHDILQIPSNCPLAPAGARCHLTRGDVPGSVLDRAAA